jgi:hypothetical protein
MPALEPQERQLLAQLVLDWLAQRSGRLLTPPQVAPDATVRARSGDDAIAIAVEPLNSGAEPAGWRAALDRFAARLEVSGEGGVLIWLPPGAAPPEEEPAATTAVMAVQTAIDATAPGQSNDALLPIRIGLHKREASGAYVSAFGGLAPLWAQFTDRVQGYFQIDSTALHRLSEEEALVHALIERIVEASAGMEVGETRGVEAEDRWRVQRLRGGHGCAVVAVPPQDDTESGAPLRRRLRTVVRDAGEQLAGENAALRALALCAHYPTLDQEQAGPALRGQDPALFAGLDLIVLLADGGVKLLLDLTRKPLAQPRATAR